MTDDEITENIAFANTIAERYGCGLVAANKVYNAYEQTSKLQEWGFITVKPGLYCQPCNDGIVRVVKLQAWKGGAYSPVCGVSLSFMPHAWDPKLRWHKGVKSPRLDVFERHIGVKPKTDRANDLVDTGMIGTLNGDKYMRLTCEALVRRSDPEMQAWFAGIDSLDDLLTVARRQDQGHERYQTHHPNPRLVAIFLLARLGRCDEAWNEFERYPINWETDIGRRMLKQGLEEVCAARRV